MITKVAILCYEVSRCYEAGEKVLPQAGQGMARYTLELLKNLNLVRGAKNLSFMAYTSGSSPKNTLLRNLNRLRFFSKVRNIEAHLYHAITPILGVPLAVFNKFPFLVTVHDLLIFYKAYKILPEIALNITYVDYVLDKASYIITVAEYWKRELTHFFNLSSKKIHVIYNGVDIEKFRPLPNIRTHGDTKKVLYIGTPTKLDGLYLLIEAVTLASKEVKGLELMIGGKLPYHDIARLCKKLNVKAKLLGFIPENELPRVYNMADVFVNPPTDEHSLMLLEAMACGTPVIARDRFEIREYLGDSAILIKSNDVGELSNAIAELLSCQEPWFKLSQRGIERAKRFTWRKMAEEVYKLYIKCIDDSDSAYYR